MIYLAGTDFSHLTDDELINGIKALNIPNYIRTKSYGIDVRETLAQMTEMLMQLAYNQGMSPQQAQEFVYRINHKINKGEVAMSDLTQEVKEALTGGSVAVVGVDAVGTENVKKDAITPTKTSFLTLDTSINLFGGDWENFGLAGNTFTMTLAKRSQDIAGALVEVKPSTTYSIATHPSYTGFVKINTATRIMNVGESLDGAVSIVSGLGGGLLTTFTTGANDKYLYTTLESRAFLKIVESESIQHVTDNDEYPVIPKGVSIYSKREVDAKLTNQTADNMTFLKQTGGNLFDGNWVVGKYLAGGSTDLTLTNSVDSDVAMIPVEPSTTYSVVIESNTQASDGYYYFKVGTSSSPLDDLKFATSDIAIDGLKVAISLGRLYYTFTTNSTDKTLIILAGKDSHPYMEVTKGTNTKLVYSDYTDKNYTFKENILINKTKKKKWVFFGDSLVQLKKLPELVSEIIGEDITDVSFAGGALTRHNTYYNAQSVLTLTEQVIAEDFTPLDTALNEAAADGQNVSAKRINQSNLTNTDFSKVDGVIVLAGTNDYGGARHPIDQFEANVRVLIENFYKINSEMEVYFVTPPFRVDWNNSAYPHNLKEYITVIKELCTEYNLPCKDLFHESGVNQFNHTSYLTADGLHQNELGDELFAEKIAKFLMSK